jgi:serine/threonine protein kinase
MEGLNHLHQRNIIHRDIKPENIILDRCGYARITDLGIARYWKPENSHETSGTPGYMAPEVLMRKNHSFCADLYAVGVIAYELVVGKRPYMGRDRKSIRDEMYVKEAKIPLIYSSKISKEGVDFINKVNVWRCSCWRGTPRRDWATMVCLRF